jgi:hypothetical protein
MYIHDDPSVGTGAGAGADADAAVGACSCFAPSDLHNGTQEAWRSAELRIHTADAPTVK